MTRIVAVEIGGEIEPWESIGLHIAGGRAVVGSVAIRFVGGKPGIRRVLVDDPDKSIALSASQPSERGGADPSAFEIDDSPWGLASSASPLDSPQHAPHPVGAKMIDHFVLMTPDMHRTCGAIELVLGEPLKKIRNAGNGVQQGFFRLGEVIVEVVESPQVPPGGAVWWGLVLIVDDLDEVTAWLGPDVISLPRKAVQPGRFIASVRSSVGLGVPVALMSR